MASVLAYNVSCEMVDYSLQVIDLNAYIYLFIYSFI